MKKISCMFTLTIGLAALAGGSQLKAQDLREQGTVPFDFVTATKTFKAGPYTVGRVTPRGELLLRNNETGEQTFINAPNSKIGEPGTAKLTFHKYGNVYYLVEVWFPQESIGHAVIPTKREKESATAQRMK